MNTAATALQASQLACIRGARRLFHHVEVDLRPGDALRVSGTNGSGKSSLLRILCGLATPSKGVVSWRGADIRRQRSEFARSLVYLGHARGIKDELTPVENLMAAAGVFGARVTRAEAERALEAVGLTAVQDLPCHALSQGQRKRAALARLELKEQGALWVLDEPFSALDRPAVDALSQTLERHLARGGMLVYTTHQDVGLEAARAQELDLDRARAW